MAIVHSYAVTELLLNNYSTTMSASLPPRSSSVIHSLESSVRTVHCRASSSTSIFQGKENYISNTSLSQPLIQQSRMQASCLVPAQHARRDSGSLRTSPLLLLLRQHTGPSQLPPLVDFSKRSPFGFRRVLLITPLQQHIQCIFHSMF